MFECFVSILLDESKTEKKRGKERGTHESEEEPIIVMLGSQRRAVPELGRVLLSPDTTSGAGSPRVSLRGLPQRGSGNLI